MVVRERKKSSRKGFSLVEVAAALMVFSVGMPALAYMYVVALVVDTESTNGAVAQYIANSLLNEISVRRFKEDLANPGNGPESGEVSGYSRLGFDDIDDYKYFNTAWIDQQPPRSEDGTELTEYAKFKQNVDVVNINPPDLSGALSLSPVSAGTTDVKLVTVVVRWTGRQRVVAQKVFFTP